jgi:hypothetical protein
VFSHCHFVDIALMVQKQWWVNLQYLILIWNGYQKGSYFITDFVHV